MDEKFIKKLLKETEHRLLDFKTTFYDISDRKSKTDFVKDILSFANSTINEPGYIICGVKVDYTGEKQILGVDKNTRVDDANWVQLLKSYSSHPVNFKIEKFTLDTYNRTLVVIEISKDQHRPVICTKDEGEKLRQGAIYFRNGSSNDIAKDLVTIEKIISNSTRLNPNNTISNDPTYNKYSKFPPPPYYKFLGRDDEINLIYEELIYHHKNYLLSLTGDGGIGKTSIAYKVAHQVKESIKNGENEFDDVIWISAKDQRIYFDERRQLHREFNSLEDLYNKILLVFYDKNFIQSLDFYKKEEYVNQALESAKFFIVLDNLEVFSNEEIADIHRFIKNAPLGHKFLLTSRHDLRVQEFIHIEKFGEDISKIYISELIKDLVQDEETQKRFEIQISDNFDRFYKLTNGNPLYIKFFIAQMIRNRGINDILERRNLEAEKPLKAYCFDSTLNNLEANELLLMYSLAVSENNHLSFHELKYVTSIEHTELQNVLESLCSQSMLYKEYQNGQLVYSLNNLLRSYLIEEKRIPGAEYNRLHQKTRKISRYTKNIREDYAFNFGLKTLINKNEIMSYNMILEVLDTDGVQSEQYLQEIMTLYPGNYLVPFYKNFIKIKERKVNPYNIYSDINSEFAHVINMNNYDEQKVMLYVWKSFLYLMLEKYDDIIQDIDYVMKTYNTEHKSLLGVLKGSALNMQALHEYKHGRYTNHDQYREEADSLFQEYFEDFLSKPYFFFIKKHMSFAYNKNNHHLKKQTQKVTNFSPFATDISFLKNQRLF
ncbi:MULTISPECIES: RNA-binding domain-containing protein [Geobacillus]|nr:RNA-binding domain-containing protein [[Bacillus] caldolyticus]